MFGYICTRIKKMTTKIKFKTNPFFALLLLVVFLFALVYKPVHILTNSHHSDICDNCVQPHQQSINTHHNTCPVCEFEFCTFIPQDQIFIPRAIVILERKLTARTLSCLTQQASQHYQLRAPPSL